MDKEIRGLIRFLINVLAGCLQKNSICL